MNENNFKEALENKLNKVFNPVAPRKSYVDELKRRLTSRAEVSVEYPNYFILILTISSGLLIGVVLIMFLNKLFKALSGKES